MAVTEYMERRFVYGGEVTTRGAIIADLQAQGVEQVYIDRYLQGIALAHENAGVYKVA